MVVIKVIKVIASNSFMGSLQVLKVVDAISVAHLIRVSNFNFTVLAFSAAGYLTAFGASVVHSYS